MAMVGIRARMDSDVDGDFLLRWEDDSLGVPTLRKLFVVHNGKHIADV